MLVAKHSRNDRARLVCFLIFLVLTAMASAGTGPPVADRGGPSAHESSSRSRSGSNSNTIAPASDASKYVGSETCKGCHEETYNAWEKTAHWKTTLNKREGPSHQGCEGCHGPGGDHVAGGGDTSKIFTFKDVSRQESNKLCLGCHGDGREQSHFAQSSHSSSEVGCLDCHSPHHAKESEHLLVQKSPQLCYGCHTAAKADFAKPYHHRVNEGLVQCSDCHNAHGTATLRQVRARPSGDAACTRCHADTQGPFVYEHVPVKTEGCSSCHSPHGSSNPRLLKVSLVNVLCLQCHTFPTQGPIGPAHNQSAKYQACTTCHGQIHGSNFSSVFFK
jgi:DmsE family decaheme c-type cytochrome